MLTILKKMYSAYWIHRIWENWDSFEYAFFYCSLTDHLLGQMQASSGISHMTNHMSIYITNYLVFLTHSTGNMHNDRHKIKGKTLQIMQKLYIFICYRLITFCL